MNNENNRYELYYIFDMGNNNDLYLPFAVRYLQYIGTATDNASSIAKKFYYLASSYNVSATNDEVYVSLSGPSDNFEAALSLFENLIHNCVSDSATFQNFISSEMKNRSDAKLSKGQILSRLSDYLIYGRLNPSNHQLSDDLLKNMNSDQLINWLHQLTTYQHSIYYYGPLTATLLDKELKKFHKVPGKLKAPPTPIVYSLSKPDQNTFYLVNYPMVQTEILWKHPAGDFTTGVLPSLKVFNSYFGGGMSSLVFQTIRESKALAYSTYSTTSTPSKLTPLFSRD